MFGSFILFVLIAALFVYFHNRLKAIEDRLDDTNKQTLTHTLTDNQKKDLPRTPPPPPYMTDMSKTAVVNKNSPSALEQFGRWFAKDWPLKTGALLILLGFVWLVSYAFLNNWIGPQGRIMLGILVGTGTILGGDRLMRRSAHQGVVLEGLGASITLVTIFAAQNLYSMFDSIIALILSSAVMVLTGISSIRHNQRSLIVVALLSGGLAPILTGSNDPDMFKLFSYLLVVVAGSLWVVRYKDWRFLTPLALILVWLYSANAQVQLNNGVIRGYNDALSPMDILWLKFFSTTFISLFFGTSLTSIITSKKATLWDLATSILVGMYALGWISSFIPEHLQSLAVLGLAVAFITGAFLAFRATGVKSAVYVYAGASILLLLIATMLEFEGPVLIIALSAQAIIMSVTADKLFGESIGRGLLFYFLVPIVLSFEAIGSSAWNSGFIHEEFFSLVSLGVSLSLSGYYFRKHKNNTVESARIGKLLVIVGSVYGLILIWLVLSSAISFETLATTLSLIIYTVIGLACYISGQTRQSKILERYGLILLILVIVRLIFVEIWDMILAWRIVTFFVIGLLLIGSVLLRKQTRT